MLKKLDVDAATHCFEQCVSLRSSCLHDHNEELVAAEDKLAQCHARSGRFADAAQTLKRCLDAVSFRLVRRRGLCYPTALLSLHELNKTCSGPCD